MPTRALIRWRAPASVGVAPDPLCTLGALCLPQAPPPLAQCPPHRTAPHQIRIRPNHWRALHACHVCGCHRRFLALAPHICRAHASYSRCSDRRRRRRLEYRPGAGVWVSQPDNNALHLRARGRRCRIHALKALRCRCHSVLRFRCYVCAVENWGQPAGSSDIAPRNETAQDARGRRRHPPTPTRPCACAATHIEPAVPFSALLSTSTGLAFYASVSMPPLPLCSSLLTSQRPPLACSLRSGPPEPPPRA